jgi:pimeloyl-ACP methyl ester carboxylesterase
LLEIIDRGQNSTEHPHPVVLIHGAWHGAWCWEGTFLDFFAARGFRVVAVSLRGHGSSALGGTPLWRTSIADYLADVVSIVEKLPAAPILIGHSMGGFVVQKYLERRHAPAGVLLAPTPPRGQLRSLARLAREHPLRSLHFGVTGDPAHLYGSIAQARALFFGDQASDALVGAVVARLITDSARVIQYDMVLGDLVDPSAVVNPVLVLAGEKDRIYRPDEARRTARAYDTDARIFEGMGHELMLEPGWAHVAGAIEAWLADHGL